MGKCSSEHSASRLPICLRWHPQCRSGTLKERKRFRLRYRRIREARPYSNRVIIVDPDIEAVECAVMVVAESEAIPNSIRSAGRTNGKDVSSGN
jgi:hypothetical protein